MNRPSLIFPALLMACVSRGDYEGRGVSDFAPDVSYYVGMGEDCCGEDPHPVHGVETEDGHFILGGKFIDSSGNPNGFVLKLSSGSSEHPLLLEDGADGHEWTYTFGEVDSFDVVNSVAAKAGAVFVAGANQSETGAVQQFLAKLDANSGEKIWSTVFPVSNGLESAFESIELTTDGGAVVAGFTNAEPGGIEGFKSYGNPYGGVANVLYLSASQLNADQAPEGPTWQQEYDGVGSIRSIKETEDGYVFVTSKSEELYTVVKIDDVGNQQWSQDLTDHGEATDIAVVTDEGEQVGFAVTGHHHNGQGIDGAVTFLELGGEIRSTTFHGDPAGGVRDFEGLDAGNPSLIYDECWGIQPTNKGTVVIACGTGIEDCSLGNAGLGVECRNDPRTTWRSLLMEIDGSGEQVWYRTDSFYYEEEEGAAATAAEHVIQVQSGGFAAVLDQDFGVGLMVLGSE